MLSLDQGVRYDPGHLESDLRRPFQFRDQLLCQRSRADNQGSPFPLARRSFDNQPPRYNAGKVQQPVNRKDSSRKSQVRAEKIDGYQYQNLNRARGRDRLDEFSNTLEP